MDQRKEERRFGSGQAVPATDWQLAQLGARLGLRHDTLHVVLELLKEMQGVPLVELPGKEGEQQPLSARLLRLLPSTVVRRLQAVPGLYLLADGITSGQFVRAVVRLSALGVVRKRLLQVASGLETLEEQQMELVLLFLRALLRSRAAGRITDPWLNAWLKPLPQLLRPQRTSRRIERWSLHPRSRIR